MIEAHKVQIVMNVHLVQSQADHHQLYHKHHFVQDAVDRYHLRSEAKAEEVVAVEKSVFVIDFCFVVRGGLEPRAIHLYYQIKYIIIKCN